MSDVFISYKREDEAKVGRLVRALEKAGVNLWWDRGLPGGESWRQNIQAALDRARCVVVVWTHESTGPLGDFVRDEAGQAKARAVLVPVLLERGVRPPLGFGEVQAIDLTHWRGGQSDPFFRDLLAAIEAKLTGRDVPPAKGPMARLLRRLTFGGVASAMGALALGFAMNVMEVQQRVCAAPLAQPAISDACGALALGGRPSREARLAFEALPPGDCEALAGFRDAFESSPLRAVADSRLADRRAQEEWREDTLSLSLYQPMTEAAGSETLARAAALTAAQGQAERVCRNTAASGVFRLRGAQAAPEEWRCEARGSGHACSMRGTAQCDLERRVEVYRCGGGARTVN